MKRIIVAFGLVAIAAACVYAATVGTVLRPAGTLSVGGPALQIIHDSTEAHDKVETDTFFSDTLDISAYSRASLFYNLGTVVKCDSCNDSIKLYITVYGGGPNSLQWTILKTDTMGANNITAADDSTKIRYIYLDTIPVTKLFVRTIVFDSLLKQWTWPQDSIVNATAAGKFTTTIPLHFWVGGR